MNNIYIINKNFNCEISLNFKTNTFEKDNKNYNFEIIDKQKILLYWGDLKEYYYTNDSYLYFSDMKLSNNVKFLNLINNTWFDQIILFLDIGYIKRIKHTDQIGTILSYDESMIMINWEHWGFELYNKFDNFTYIIDNYEYPIIDNFKKFEDYPIHIFMHICTLEDWKEIFSDQIDTIKKSGLYDNVTLIHLGILGNINNINDPIFNDPKFNILYVDSRCELFELNTINFIKYYCSKLDHEIYVLYLHTKGVRKAGNPEVTKSWRKMMEYFLIDKYIECLHYIDIYDTLGCNIVNLNCVDIKDSSINEKHTMHYSGNFWWSKKTYIDKLPYINIDLSKKSVNMRYKAENWILSNYPEAKIGILFQDETNTHPYHRYIYDYYKKLKFIVRNLSI